MRRREKNSKPKKEKGKDKRKEKKEEVEQTEEWKKDHPWKPWNRETDLAAGRKSMKVEGKESMAKGLTSRFSGGGGTREFL